MNTPQQSDSLLEGRLRQALAASTRPDGNMDHDWLTMHIWLSLTDQLQAAYCRSNGACSTEHERKRAFAGKVREINACMKRVLPRVMPLMAEFSEMKRVFQWRAEGRGLEAATDSTFMRAAAAAGIPISDDDIVYALGPDGPAGQGSFERVWEKVSSSLLN